MNEVFEGEKEGSFLLLWLTGRRVKKEKGLFRFSLYLFQKVKERSGKTTLSVLT